MVTDVVQDCEMCDGLMEIDATTIERLGHVGCPLCVERKLMARIAALEALVGDLKAAFRVNMLRRVAPGEDIDAEIDRVFASLEKR